jgi:hypothetical protein
MKNFILLTFILILSSGFTKIESKSITEVLSCSELTFKNTGYSSKNVYVYGKKLGETRYLAAKFGLGAGKTTKIDTSEAGYGVTWEVEVDDRNIYGFGCEYTF